MTVRVSPYTTTVCNDCIIDNVIHAVQTGIIKGTIDVCSKIVLAENISNAQISWADFQHQVYVVDGRPGQEHIPVFTHPLVFKLSHSDHEETVAVDIRAFGQYNRNQMCFVARNTSECTIAIMRGCLTSLWSKPADRVLLRNLGNIPISVYCSWLSESIAKRFSLNPQEQLTTAILAGILYMSNFEDSTEVTEDSKRRMVTAITSALRCSPEEVVNIIEKVTFQDFWMVNSLQTFCDSLKSITESVRLVPLNAGLLCSIVANTWISYNSREMIAVAIEHPPTWLAVLNSAYRERTFKNSIITKITERSNNRNGEGMLANLIKIL